MMILDRGKDKIPKLEEVLMHCRSSSVSGFQLFAISGLAARLLKIDEPIGAIVVPIVGLACPASPELPGGTTFATLEI